VNEIRYNTEYIKVKWSRYRPGVAQRVGRGIALLFHARGTRRGEWPAARPGRSLPPGKTRYPLYRRLGGPQGRSGQVRKISPPLGFDPRTVQPVASRYTDWVTGPTIYNIYRGYRRRERGWLVGTQAGKQTDKWNWLLLTSVCRCKHLQESWPHKFSTKRRLWSFDRHLYKVKTQSISSCL